MKRIVCLTVAAWTLAQCVCVLGQGLITEEAAKQAVCQFENNPSLELVCVELEEDTSGPTWSHRSWYTIKQVDYDLTHRLWTVDAHTAEVDHASYDDLGPLSPYAEPGASHAKEVYRPAAEDFARARYNGFDTMGFVLTTEKWVGIGWLYGWQQKVAYDALTPNIVTVVVAPESGYILQYVSVRVTTPAPRPPQITSAQALAIAKLEAGITTADDIEGPVLSTDPDGNVVWSVTVGGEDAADCYVNYAVEVDAETGVVLSASPARLPSRKDYRSRTVKLTADGPSENPLVLRDVLAERGYQIHWDQTRRRVVARRGNDTVIVEVGNRMGTVNGRQLQFSQPPILQDGRVRVPRALASVLP